MRNHPSTHLLAVSAALLALLEERILTRQFHAQAIAGLCRIGRADSLVVFDQIT